jgi:hypothetical protein
MIKVFGTVTGGDLEAFEVADGATVKQVYEAMGLEGTFLPSVNGRPATMETVVAHKDEVDFANKKDGGI